MPWLFGSSSPRRPVFMMSSMSASSRNSLARRPRLLQLFLPPTMVQWYRLPLVSLVPGWREVCAKCWSSGRMHWRRPQAGKTSTISVPGSRIFSSRTSWSSTAGEMSCASARTPGVGEPATSAGTLSARRGTRKGRRVARRNDSKDSYFLVRLILELGRAFPFG
jgi:hypothetical protein